MEFMGTDPQSGCHGFRCPPDCFHRKNEPFKGYAVCGDWSREDPDENV